MKKFIAAFDGLDFCESTMEYAIDLAKKCESHLVGVFFEDFTRRSYTVAEMMQYEGADLDKYMQAQDEGDRTVRQESIEVFEKACQRSGLNYTIHRDKNVAIRELLHESIYADLLIISGKETITHYKEPEPTRFIKELLNDVQCPVLAVPSKYNAINKVILLYDGEPSSVHAVRMFSYLFDPMKSLPTEVLTIKNPDESFHVPDNRLIKEFMKRHYPEAEYTVLKGWVPEKQIYEYLHREKANAIVALGAYRRGKVSRLFRPSMADYLLGKLQLPFFIAHNKS